MKNTRLPAENVSEGMLRWLTKASEMFQSSTTEKMHFVLQFQMAWCAANEELRRFNRIAAIDEVLGVAQRIASNSHGVLTNANRQEMLSSRLHFMEEQNLLLKRELDREKAEHSHCRKSLEHRERQMRDLNSSRLQMLSNAVATRISAATQTSSSSTRSYRNDYDLLLLRCDEMQRRSDIAFLEIEHFQQDIQFAERVHSAHLWNALRKKMQKDLMSSTVENEMLHEELSLCLRRIARLESEAHMDSAPDDSPAQQKRMQHNYRDAAVMTDAVFVRAEVEEREQLLRQSEEAAKLRLLLRKYVVHVTTKVVESASDIVCHSVQ